MAEPAWVLQARRARIRRYVARDKGRDWLRLGQPLFWSRSAWPIWFIRLLRILFPEVTSASRSWRTYRAAQAARAALEGNPAHEFQARAPNDRPSKGSPPSGSARSVARGAHALSLRY